MNTKPFERKTELKNADNNFLLKDDPQRVHPIMFAGIDKEMIRKAAIKTQGGSGLQQ